MTNASPKVVPLASAHFQRAEETLASALQHEPVCAYFFPQVPSRLERMRRVVRAGLRYALRYGAVDTASEAAGVAVWHRPEFMTLTWTRMLGTGMLSVPWAAGWRASRRIRTYLRSIEAVHSRSISGPHWYLRILGVRPESQGQRLGTSLGQHGLERAQADGLPCYLETTNERNVAFYQKNGFRLVQQGQVPNDGPLIWGFLT
jgi:ribosomal protein S18 acetylase RimI-like enzyme